MPVIRIYQDHLHKHKKGGVNLGSPRKNNPIVRCTYKKLFYALNWAPVSTSQYIYSTHLINYTKNSHQNSHQPQQNLCMKRIFVLAGQGHKHWGFFPLPFLPHFFHLFDLTWAKTRSQAGGYPWLFPRLHVFSHPNPRPKAAGIMCTKDHENIRKPFRLNVIFWVSDSRPTFVIQFFWIEFLVEGLQLFFVGPLDLTFR